MLAAASPRLRHPKLGGRKPLQPKNTILTTTNNNYDNNPKPTKIKIKTPPPISFSFPSIITDDEDDCIINKENIPVIESMDSSLAEELTAVKQKLERIKLEREKTEKLLQERDHLLQLQMSQLFQRGEFQKDLELEVDRLFRLKQLHLASMRMSPIKSLREKEMEKNNNNNNKDSQLELNIREKSGENKEEKMDKLSKTESPIMSSTSSSKSTSESTTTATPTWKIVLPIPIKFSLESDLDDN